MFKFALQKKLSFTAWVLELKQFFLKNGTKKVYL